MTYDLKSDGAILGPAFFILILIVILVVILIPNVILIANGGRLG